QSVSTSSTNLRTKHFVYRGALIAADVFEITSGDNLLALKPGHPYPFKTIPVSRSDECRWLDALGKTWDFLRGYDPLIAQEIGHTLSTIVPIVSTNEWSDISATSTDLPGAAYLSLSNDPLTMAELLVHEYHHTKLNAILESVTIFSGENQEEKFYSPW